MDDLTTLQQRWVEESYLLDQPERIIEEGYDEHFEERIKWEQECERKISGWQPPEPTLTAVKEMPSRELKDPAKWVEERA